MNNKHFNELVGKSFEDLTVEEMRVLQGGADAIVYSTPLTIIVSIELSKAGISASSMVTTMLTASKIVSCK